MARDSIYFEAIRGKKIFCYLHEPDIISSFPKIVIMNHGFRGTSVGTSRAFVNFARYLVTQGISVLRFDQPNCGNSEGDFIDASFNEWVQTTIYLAKKYLKLHYQVALLGNSIGATTCVIASNNAEIQGRIACLLLWVPDPKATFSDPDDNNTIYEEGGEQYRCRFWMEAQKANFFACLQSYTGGIHLVYGEHDRYISTRQRNQVKSYVQAKGQPILILSGHNHGPWEYASLQRIYQEELNKLKEHFGMLP